MNRTAQGILAILAACRDLGALALVLQLADDGAAA